MRDRKRSIRLRLWDIPDAIAKTKLAVDGLSLEMFQSDTIRRLAAERAVEIISEASRHIPEDQKAGAAHVPWRQIAGIGNVLRHSYKRVEAGAIWALINNDLAPLERAARHMMDGLEES